MAAQKGTNAERPIEYITCADPAVPTTCTNVHPLGVASPDFRIGLSPTFAFKRFAITGLVDWSQGGKIYNQTAQSSTQDCADRRCDQFGKAPQDRIAERFYRAGLYSGNQSNEAFVEDATFLKIRELSVNYTFNRRELSKVGLGRWISELRVGVIGRNLFTFTPYSGLDPDVAPATGDPFRPRVDLFQYPQFRTVTATVEIAF